MSELPGGSQIEVPRRPASSWGLGPLLAAVAAGWLFLQLLPVVGAIVGAALLAAALEPAVNRLTGWRLSGWRFGRRAASGIAVAGLLLGLLLLAALLAPELGREAREAGEWIPKALQAGRQLFSRLEASVGGPGSQGSAILHDEGSKLLTELGRAAGGLALRLTMDLLNVLSLFLIPVGAFYFLADGGEIRERVLRMIPVRHRDSVAEGLTLVDRSLSLYVRGQTAVCVAAAVLYSLLFLALGLPNPLLLGTIAGLAEAIPYLGAVTTTTVVALAGLTVDAGRAGLAVVVYFAVGNSFVNYFLAPRLLSRRLEIHPFLVMIASLAGAALGGVLGALLALPTAVVLQNLVVRYSGGGETKAESSDS